MTVTYKRLGDVASFVRGITFKPTDVVPAGTSSSVWCMRTKNVQAQVDLSDVWSVDSKFVKRSEQYLEEGDVLISSANSWNLVGKCCWIPRLGKATSFGGFVTALRGDVSQVNRRYLYRWFASAHIQETARSFSRQTTNIANLDLKRCADLSVPLPPLPEQRRIVAVLDRVDSLRVKRREAIALLEDLAQSTFLDMFGNPATNPEGWPLGTVGEILESATYGTSEKASLSGDVPILRMGNVTSSGEIDTTKLKYLTGQQVPEKYMVRCGDVLFNRTNSAELVGKSAIYRRDKSVAYAGYLVRLRVNEKNNPEYLAAYLNSAYAKAWFRVKCKSIVGMANINAKEVQAMRLAMPPLELQLKFAECVKGLESAKRSHRLHLATLDELFESLQQRAFAGQLWDH